MIFEYGKAPMHYVDGIPAYKHGEWEGKTSCKFSATRRVIRPLTDGIIFNGKIYNNIFLFHFKTDNEPPLISKKKVLIPKPSPEYQFKPCIKMIKQETDKNPKIESIRIIKPTPKTEEIVRPKRTEYFKYQQDHIKDLMKKSDDGDNKSIIKNELKHLSKIGFTKRVMEALPNNKILTFKFDTLNSGHGLNQKSHSVQRKNEFVGPTSIYSWQQKEQEKLNVIKHEHENLKKDIQYVKKLNDWDTKFLPKIK